MNEEISIDSKEMINPEPESPQGQQLAQLASTPVVTNGGGGQAEVKTQNGSIGTEEDMKARWNASLPNSGTEGDAAVPKQAGTKKERTAFERAASFAKAVAAGGRGKAQDIYTWEHGVAVEPWPEPVDGKALLDALEELVKRFLVLPKWAAATLALWILHTYAFVLRQVATYVGIESPEMRCGKTTLLTVLCELVNRPVVASNISSPAFFRVIEEKEPTLLIDEADTVLHRNKELRGILNAGYKMRTGYVIRMTPQRALRWKLQRSRGQNGNGEHPASEKAGEPTGDSECGGGEERNAQAPEPTEPGLELARFSCWCPKAIALIKHLPPILADRCIVIQMQRKRSKEKCERLRNLKGEELRRKCERFVLDHAEEIASAQPELPEDLNDRAADIREPLLALADLAGGEWPEKARKAALGLTAVSEEETPIGALLLDMMILFCQERAAQENPEGGVAGNPGGGAGAAGGANGDLPVKRTKMFSRDIVAALNRRSDRPWLVLRRGKQIDEMWLSQQLAPFGIRPRTVWKNGTSAKGYVEEDFTEAFHRYISKGAALRFIAESREVEEEEARSKA